MLDYSCEAVSGCFHYSSQPSMTQQMVGNSHLSCSSWPRVSAACESLQCPSMNEQCLHVALQVHIAVREGTGGIVMEEGGKVGRGEVGRGGGGAGAGVLSMRGPSPTCPTEYPDPSGTKSQPEEAGNPLIASSSLP